MTAIKTVERKLKNNGATGITVWDFPAGFALAARIKDLRDSGKKLSQKQKAIPTTMAVTPDMC